MRIVKIVSLFLIILSVFFSYKQSAYADNTVKSMNVVFLSPGNEEDSFWGLVTSFMKAAAKDLDVNLEIVYCDRAHYLIKHKGLEIIRRDSKPDYLILVNELNTAADLIKEADAQDIKTLLFNEIFLGEDSLIMGAPQQNYKNWLFELRPDDYQAGYLLAKELIRIRKKEIGELKPIYIAGITGPEDNSSSILRVNGLQDAVSEDTSIKLLQVTSADYDEDKAAKISAGLIKRYPDLDIIWTASDRMALGVEQALAANKFDALTGGVDWDMGAINSLSAGGVDVSVGGHFMDGAWLLVMLYDHHHGMKFERLKAKSSFIALTNDNIKSYLDNFGDNEWDKIDFTKYSKVLNQNLSEYSFQLEELELNGI